VTIYNKSVSLYIHIPFCTSFCDYCDFFSITKSSFNDEYIDAFLRALINDIKKQIDIFSINEIPTVYIGGGTPSVLGEKIKFIFNELKKIPFFSPVEFTVEANPESLNEEFLDACRDGGINRLSLGIQTFHEISRSSVNRKGDENLLKKSLALASKYFPDVLSIDLITGLPYHNEKIILDDINKILDFSPSHISLYNLSVESNTILEEKIKNKNISLPNADNSDYLWLKGRDALLKAGFEHYEVSNFAKNRSNNIFKRCLHNIRYWQMKSWIGAGPSASATLIDEDTGTAQRFTFTEKMDQSIKNDEQFAFENNIEKIDRITLLKESILMGFRYIDGPDEKLFKKRFNYSIEECIPQTLIRWKDKDKMLFLNQFLIEAFEEIDKKHLDLF